MIVSLNIIRFPLQLFNWLFLIGLFFCFVGLSHAATYYVDVKAQNDYGTGTQASPKKYIQSGLDLLNESGGDTLVIKNGVYSSQKDQITYSHVPSGTNYTIIRAETDFGVTINSPFILGDDNHSTNHIIINGIRFVSPGGTTGGSIFVGKYAKFQKCAFVNSLAERYGNNLGLGSKFNPVTEYVLVEDCYAYGQGGRYKFQTQTVKKVIFRRVVARSDGGWGNSGGNPEAVLMTYNSEDVLWQNCIAIDSDLEYEYWSGAFYVANKGDSDFPIKLKNISWLGNIVINVRSHAFHLDLDLDAANLYLKDNLVLSGENSGRGVFSYKKYADATIENMTIINAERGIYENYSGGSINASNFIVINSNDVNIGGNVNASSFCSWKNGSATDGASFTQNPFQSGLTYPVRIEEGSPLKTAGAGKTQIGAEIFYQRGVSGTVWGEPGYNELTSEMLWPFPNEAQIRSDMRTEPGVGTRGFCADGQTLTKYIWEYLGNQIPAEIFLQAPKPIITNITIHKR